MLGLNPWDKWLRRLFYISKQTQASRFSVHPSVSTCYRALLADIPSPYPKFLQSRDWVALPPTPLPYIIYLFLVTPSLLGLLAAPSSPLSPAPSPHMAQRSLVMATLYSPRCPCLCLALPHSYNKRFHPVYLGGMWSIPCPCFFPFISSPHS